MSLIEQWADNEVTRKVVGCLLAKAKGVMLAGDFDEDNNEIYTTADAVLVELAKWNISEVYIHQVINSASAKQFMEGNTKGLPWVKLVFSNEHIISDYSTNLTSTLRPALAMADAFAGADLAKLDAIIREVVGKRPA